MTGSSLPKLSAASFESLDEVAELTNQDEAAELSNQEEYSYRSGASFKGHVHDYKKTGRGIFTWPNGSRYEGDFLNDRRSGKGVQLWPDRSEYDGHFMDDLRHGQGQHSWINGEMYSGTFFRDRRHGAGTYSWSDGSSYTGTFFMDRKEGYGKFTLANGNVFEGLYKEDERKGPGVLTYKDGREDVGLWQGEKLVKLCSHVSGIFSMKDHPEFDYGPQEHITYMNFTQNDKTSAISLSHDIYGFVSESDITHKLETFFNDTLDPRSYAINREIFDREFFKGNKASCKEAENEHVPMWNKSSVLILMQEHVHKHRFSQKNVSFDVLRIINGDRSKHKAKGPLELSSEKLLVASMAGNRRAVEDLLDGGKIHVDVTDRIGHTSLIGACVNWHISIINMLLNHGADVNKLNDDGCSALSAICIYYYPIESFHYNIAERYLEKPPELLSEEEEPRSRGILGKKKSSLSSARTVANLVRGSAKMLGVSMKSAARSKDSGVQVSLSASPKYKRHLHIHDQSPGIGERKAVTVVDPGRLSVASKDEDRDSALESDDEYQPSLGETLAPEDFESGNSVRNYPIEVSETLLDRCATNLSLNERVVSGRRSRDLTSEAEGTARYRAIQISERELMKKTLDLLLRRGANPNASCVPMPVLFFAIKAADVEVVKTLLMKGATTSTTLTSQKGGLAPLHIAVAIPGDEGVQITELLLDALAYPDVRATLDDSFLNRTLEEEWGRDPIDEVSQELLGGRTPLHIAAARDDNYKHACKVIGLLLHHKGRTDVLCNGFSPLALAIASGNDMAIDELLAYGADPSLRLTHGVGSALCVASSTEYEHRRSSGQRLGLIDKLVRAGADVLSPILIGPKRLPGTAIDYAYYMFNQDRVIAHMPYHALTHAERDTYNDRRKLLGHLGETLRKRAVERERQRMEEDSRRGRRSESPSQEFIYVGAGAPLPPGVARPKSMKVGPQGEGHVTFQSMSQDNMGQVRPITDGEDLLDADGSTGIITVQGKDAQRVKASLAKRKHRANIRKPLFKYCYECGRSVGVRLTACTRCKEVFYCSKACKLKAWNSRHKQECIRLGSSTRSPSEGRQTGRMDSPTRATVAGKANPATVAQLTKDKHALKITVPVKGKSQSARGVRKKVYVDREGNRVKSADALMRDPALKMVYMDNYSFV